MKRQRQIQGSDTAASLNKLGRGDRHAGLHKLLTNFFSAVRETRYAHDQDFIPERICVRNNCAFSL
jgi:hypothetical protein